MKQTDLINLVLDGRLDSILDRLSEAVFARKKMIREQKAIQNRLTMTVGTRVRITTGLRPKYLVGLLGTVVEPWKLPREPKKDAIAVHLDTDPGVPARGRLRYDQTLAIPASCLEEVPPESKIYLFATPKRGGWMEVHRKGCSAVERQATKGELNGPPYEVRAGSVEEAVKDETEDYQSQDTEVEESDFVIHGCCRQEAS